jgi:hypothetical protein
MNDAVKYLQSFRANLHNLPAASPYYTEMGYMNTQWYEELYVI